VPPEAVFRLGESPQPARAITPKAITGKSHRRMRRTTQRFPSDPVEKEREEERESHIWKSRDDGEGNARAGSKVWPLSLFANFGSEGALAADCEKCDLANAGAGGGGGGGGPPPHPRGGKQKPWRSWRQGSRRDPLFGGLPSLSPSGRTSVRFCLFVMQIAAAPAHHSTLQYSALPVAMHHKSEKGRHGAGEIMAVGLRWLFDLRADDPSSGSAPAVGCQGGPSHSTTTTTTTTTIGRRRPLMSCSRSASASRGRSRGRLFSSYLERGTSSRSRRACLQRR